MRKAFELLKCILKLWEVDYNCLIEICIDKFWRIYLSDFQNVHIILSTHSDTYIFYKTNWKKKKKWIRIAFETSCTYNVFSAPIFVARRFLFTNWSWKIAPKLDGKRRNPSSKLQPHYDRFILRRSHYIIMYILLL